MLKRFDIKYYSLNGQDLKKLVKETDLMFVAIENLFDTIHSAHLEAGHGGRDVAKVKTKEKFANITADQISMYSA